MRFVSTLKVLISDSYVPSQFLPATSAVDVQFFSPRPVSVDSFLQCSDPRAPATLPACREEQLGSMRRWTHMQRFLSPKYSRDVICKSLYGQELCM